MTAIQSTLSKGSAEFFKVIDKIKSDPPALSQLLNLGSYLVHGIRNYSGKDAILSPLMGRVATVLNVISFASLFSDMDDLVNDTKGRSIVGTLSKSFFVAADFLSIGLWLDSLNVLKMSEISASVGSVPVFKTVSTAMLGAVADGLVAGAFGFMAVDACVSLSKANQEIEKAHPASKMYQNAKCQQTKSILELAWCVAEVAAKAFVLSGAASLAIYGTAGLLALSAIAAALGLSAFVYSHLHQKELMEYQRGVS